VDDIERTFDNKKKKIIFKHRSSYEINKYINKNNLKNNSIKIT
jgi:hypothetical protein